MNILNQKVIEEEKNCFNILGLPIVCMKYDEILFYLENKVINKEKTFCVTINVDILRMISEDSDFYKIVESSDLIFADGMPLVWLSKLTSTPIPERTAGCDIVNDLFKLSDSKGYKIFVLGAPNGVIRAKEKLEKALPNVKITGVYSPTLEEIRDEESNAKIVEMINNSEAEMVFVAMGAPRQEKWIYDNLDRLNSYIYIPCGGSIDCIAGVQKKAPKWIGKIGFEWLYRLMHNPKRLFNRYLIQNMPFLIKLAFRINKEKRINIVKLLNNILTGVDVIKDSNNIEEEIKR